MLFSLEQMQPKCKDKHLGSDNNIQFEQNPNFAFSVSWM
jgi:hypothetical protein